MYHIPMSNDAQHELDAFLRHQNEAATYEHLPEPQTQIEQHPQFGYEEVKGIERYIDQIRETGTRDMVAEYKSRHSPVPMPATVIKMTLKDPLPTLLLEVESRIGANVVPKPSDTLDHLFFYEDGRWYYRKVYADEPSRHYDVNYEIREDGMYKFVDGHATAVPFAEGEAEALLVNIAHYKRAVQAELYSLAA